jgi:hypothetical protein
MNMFNIEKEIFTAAATAVLAISSGCRITNSFVYAPEKFPCVSIVHTDDGMTYKMRDSSHSDNFRDITVTVDSFSNKNDGRKTEAETLMQAVIDKLASLNFTMVSCKPASNNNNASYYRLTATFTATVDADGHIYTRK